ncbi:MAG TPA: YjbA family protein [Lentibacillus sp.]|uniref:YjbA family protein n=1 Tax=Lentibacillus sp. TaxID=1925746 RepID=UPI002B4B1745|nr:YjbA family protein [Lentibacillus sp.]HLR63467.1 YjbA family protein [Lentibacillus sp.]
MLYLHDVWVNWFEGEENGYSVCHFHEWRKNDGIELLDQVPLLYITADLYDYIENDMHDLPEEMMDKIYKRAYMRKGQERNGLDFAAVVTDGNDIIAFDTIGYQIPVRKSRLIPRQEQLVFDMVSTTKPETFNFTGRKVEKEYHMLSMEPRLIHGLTRRERQLKQILMIALDQLHTVNNPEELRYWLTEWDPKKYPFIRYMDKETVWNELYEGVKKGWSQSHEDLCVKMIKGQPFLEKMWEAEQEPAQNTSKQK